MTRESHFCRHAISAAVLSAFATAAGATDYAWSSATFAAGITAPSPLPAADVLNIEAGSPKYFDGAGSNFTNGGTVNWNADALYFQSGAIVVNNALWNSTADTSLIFNGGALPSFVNNGTLRKSGGAGSTTIGDNVGFVNHGTLDAQNGTILYVGATGSIFNAGTNFTGAGANAAHGNNTWNGAFTSANLELRGGIHTGNGAEIGGTVVWTGGTMAGTWKVAAGQTLNAATGGSKILDASGTMLTNSGTLDWNTANELRVQNGAALVNRGLFVANADTSMASGGGAAPSFENTATGTVRAAAGRTLTIGDRVGFANNAGTLDAQAGGAIVYVGGTGSTFNAGTNFTGAGANVAHGNNTWNGAFTSANLELRGGTHTGNGAEIGGTVAWSGGTISGTWKVAAGQTLTGETGSGKDLYGFATALTNAGAIAWNTSDPLRLTHGATLVNQGLIDFSADTSAIWGGGAATNFVNHGLIVKSAGSGTATIDDYIGFANDGAIDVRSGTIALPKNFTNAGTLTGTGSFAAAGTLTNNGHIAPGASAGTLTIGANLTLGASGSLNLDVENLLSHGLLKVNGNTTLGGALALTCFASCNYAIGDEFMVLDGTSGALSGAFAALTMTGFGSGAFDIVYDRPNGDVWLRVTQNVSAVPELGTPTLALVGLAVLGGLMRRRRAA